MVYFCSIVTENQPTPPHPPAPHTHTHTHTHTRCEGCLLQYVQFCWKTNTNYMPQFVTQNNNNMAFSGKNAQKILKIALDLYAQDLLQWLYLRNP